MNKIGLILEGGGMRGIYTAGVLDFLIRKKYRSRYSNWSFSWKLSCFFLFIKTI